MTIHDDNNALRILYLGETSVPARSVLRDIGSLPQVRSVLEVTDPSALRQTLHAHQPDLVLVDFGITEASRERYTPNQIMPALEHYPVIALTSSEREQRGIKAVLSGAQQYLCVDRCTNDSISAALVHCCDQFAFVDTLTGRNELFTTVVDSLNDGTVIINQAGRVISVNPAARRLLGIIRDNANNSLWADSFCAYVADGASELPIDRRPLAMAANGERFSEMNFLHRTQDGNEIIFSVSGRGLTGSDGQIIGGIVTFRDITEQYGRDIELARISLFDSVTGIGNRRLFTDQLEQAVARAQRSQRTLGLLFVDLDRFKLVNDSLGHDIGDMLLREAATRLQTLLRQGDFLARWGGDEFVICIENLTSPRDAAAAAQKIVRGMSEKFVCAGHEIYISASVGIALYPEAGEKAEDLVRGADRAMYQAKRDGGAKLQFFSHAQAPFADDMHELEIGIRHALLRRELTLRYQPRVDLNNGKLLGLEALLRWQHPRYGLLPPARFLSLLESSGLIHSVGEWVIRTVCAQLQSWQQKFGMADLTVTINLSPVQLAGGRLVDIVRSAIFDNNLDAGCIEFELGDGAVSLQRQREAETLRGLRALGVGISLDHFGTQDIAFSTLDNNMVSSFVLHQSLIQDLAENDSHQRIVRAAIAMAQGLNIDISAEGVETMDQLDFLRASNCGSAQGFFISRPMDTEKVATLLHSETLGTHLLESATAA